MAFNRHTENGVTLSVRQDFKKTAYIGEFRWNNGWGINVRWDLDCHVESQHYKKYETNKDVQDVVSEGFRYCEILKK